MTEPTPLYYVGPWQDYKDTFRRAKQKDPALAQVSLVPALAEPGCGRLLAFGSPPEFVAEYALIRKTPEELDESGLTSHLLRWYLGFVQDSRTVSYAGALTRMFGREVREVA